MPDLPRGQVADLTALRRSTIAACRTIPLRPVE
jgi:hypothetical protein